MKISTPTLTETSDAIIIRIPKEWMTHPRARALTVSQVVRIVKRGEREFREGKTLELGAFLARRHPGYARALRRSR